MKLFGNLFKKKTKETTSDLIDVEYIKENPHKFMSVRSVYDMFLKSKNIKRNDDEINNVLLSNGIDLNYIKKSIIKGFIDAEAYGNQFGNDFKNRVSETIKSSLDLDEDVSKDVDKVVQTYKATNIAQYKAVSLLTHNQLNIDFDKLKTTEMLFDVEKTKSVLPKKYRNVHGKVIFKVLKENGFDLKKERMIHAAKLVGVTNKSSEKEFNSKWKKFKESDEYSNMNSKSKSYFYKSIKEFMALSNPDVDLENVLKKHPFNNKAIKEEFGGTIDGFRLKLNSNFGYTLSEYRIKELESKLGLSSLTDHKTFNEKFDELCGFYDDDSQRVLKHYKSKLAKKYNIQ